MAEHDTNHPEDLEVIYSYTRAEAIADGVLVDVTETAVEAGIKYPVALTSALWHGYIVPDLRSRKWGQSEAGRLWDVLWMFRVAARNSSTDLMYFRLYFIMKEQQKRLVTLKAVIGPGDTPEPVITIMLPHED